MNVNIKIIVWYNIVISSIFLIISTKLFGGRLLAFGLLIGLFLGVFNLLAALITIFKNRKLALLFLLIGVFFLIIGIGVCSENLSNISYLSVC